MSPYRHAFYLTLISVLAVTLAACDQSPQESGSDIDNLTVTGPESAIIPNYDSTAYIDRENTPSNPTDETVAEYTVSPFDEERSYSWDVTGATGATPIGTRLQGEVYQVNPPDAPGSYMVAVETNVNGQEVSGQASTTSTYPTASMQAEKRGLTILTSTASNAGLLNALNSGDDAVLNGYTAFSPENEAFLNALDDNDDGTLTTEELPAPGIMADILRYHTATDSLTSTDFQSGDRISTAFPGEVLTVNPVGAILVNGTSTSATVTEADIATSDGVMHAIDSVLLPDALVAAQDQSAARSASGDTLNVSGTFVSEGGFVVARDSTELADGSMTGSVVGHSRYLSPGFYKEITFVTDDQLDAQAGESVTLTFMAHRDTDGDRTYDFVMSGGTDDGPYLTSGSNSPIVENATVTIPN